MVSMQPLHKGDKVGRYQIVGELATGGMGTVYRAFDPKLKREVAVKMLVRSQAENAEAVQRFEFEAQVTGALPHENVLMVFDAGTYRAAPYIVYELLEGHTLRERLARGPLPLEKAVDYALQIARGLKVAHAKGIVHRDLKPENLFLTVDERVKILDFGLAKLLPRGRLVPARFGGDPAVASFPTAAGVLLGTVGYMSPEQVKGKPADPRSDIFAFGAILYEMLSGKRAFPGDLSEASMAIVTREPDKIAPAPPPEVQEVMRRCLAKDPHDRFQSVAELESSLASLGTGRRQNETSESLVKSVVLKAREIATIVFGASPSGGSTRWPSGRKVALVSIALALVGLAVAYRIWLWPWPFGRGPVSGGGVVIQPLTLHRGVVWSARFLPDGESVIYSSAWDGQKIQSHTVAPGGSESAPLGFPPARVLAVVGKGEFAVALERDDASLDYMRTGTLARADASGAAREILTHVRSADAGKTGELAVVRDVDGISRLEYPPGTILHTSTGWLSHARVSPSGQVAFIEHPFYGDTRGVVMLAERGKVRPITSDFGSAMGLAWSPRGGEVWFTGAETAQSSALQAVAPGGKPRLLYRGVGSVLLHDVAPDGRVLVSLEKWNHFARVRVGKGEERNLSWQDYTMARELSADGRKLLFFEAGQGGGQLFSAFVRGTDGSPAILLGAGLALSLSADGQLALIGTVRDPSRLFFVPTGAGEPRSLSLPIAAIAEARWFPDGKRVLLTAQEKDGSRRVFVMDASSGSLRPLTGPLMTGQEVISKPVSFDGRRVIVRTGEGYFLYPSEGGEPDRIEGLAEGQIPIGWHPGGAILARTPGLPTKVSLLDLSTGEQRPWREFRPPDSAGVSDVPWVHFAFPPTGEVYAYSYHQIVSDLFLLRGVE